MIHTENIAAEVDVYFTLQPTARKFDSIENRKQIVDRMTSYGIVPGPVAVQRAIQELVAEGLIERTDGGDEHTDKLGAAIAERARIDRLAAEPLTDADFTKFSRMSPSEVEQAFHSDRVFAARYTRAAKTWGFKIPVNPAPNQVDVPVESDTSQWRNLSAADYHKMPAAQITRLYMSDKGFKRRIDKLIAEGKI